MVRQLSQPEDSGGMLLLPLPLLRFMGSAAGALFLAQLLSWEAGDEGWQAFSYAQWQEQLGLSEYRVRQYTAWCEARGFLQTRVGEVRGVPVTFYRLRLQPFYVLLHELLRSGGGRSGREGYEAAQVWRRALEGEQ